MAIDYTPEDGPMVVVESLIRIEGQALRVHEHLKHVAGVGCTVQIDGVEVTCVNRTSHKSEPWETGMLPSIPPSVAALGIAKGSR